VISMCSLTILEVAVLAFQLYAYQITLRRTILNQSQLRSQRFSSFGPSEREEERPWQRG